MLHFPSFSIKMFTKFYSNTLPVLSFAKPDFKWIHYKYGNSSWTSSKVLCLMQEYYQLEDLSDGVSVSSKSTTTIGKHKNICQKFLVVTLTRMRFWRLQSFWARVRRIALQKRLTLGFSPRSLLSNVLGTFFSSTF